MLSVVLALGPIFALILLGLWLKHRQFVPEAFWPAAEKITYTITFPALLATSLGRADLTVLPWEWIAGTIAATTMLNGLIALTVVRLVLPVDRLAMGNATLSSVFQGVIRPNTYVGLAAASALFDHQGTAATAICIAATIPLVNVMAIAALSTMTASSSPNAPPVTFWSVILSVVKNPLILGCLLGFSINLIGLGFPPVVGPLLEILGRASLPIGLLAVGAGLSLRVYDPASAPCTIQRQGNPATRSQPILLRPLIVGSVMKLVLLPATTTLAVILLKPLTDAISATTASALILWAGLPCSASSYVLARQMGGDAPIMAATITVQTFAAMGSLPLIMMALSALT